LYQIMLTNKPILMFDCLAKMLIVLLDDNRYSLQLARSIKVLSDAIGIPSEDLDKSLDSLQFLDAYLDRLVDKRNIDLEILLSLTVYLSQVIILFFDGIWDIDYEACLSSSSEASWSRAIKIQVYRSSTSIIPHGIIAGGISDKKSKLKKTVRSFTTEVKVEVHDNYVLLALDDLINKGYDFFAEIPHSILKLSNTLEIPEKKLTKSISSLKIIDCIIQTGKINPLRSTKSFLELIVYVGEVVIKAIDGRWEIKAKKIRSTSLQYHWTIEIFDSRNRRLRHFVSYICDHLSEESYMYCRIEEQVKLFIKENIKSDSIYWLQEQESQ
jgi:hypothetical protein